VSAHADGMQVSLNVCIHCFAGIIMLLCLNLNRFA
jgi:hypothetical protein